jgi:hypothetical protein
MIDNNLIEIHFLINFELFEEKKQSLLYKLNY